MTSTATVRPATAADWDGFRSLYESIAGEGRWIGAELPITWDDDRRRRWDESIVSDQTCVLLAEVDGRPIGWISGELALGRVEFGMGIVDGYRGHGIGGRLLEALVAWARASGAHKVTLQLWPHNTTAQALYEKFGFEVEGRLRRHWRRNDGSLWDAVSMGLVLDETSPGSPFASDAPAASVTSPGSTSRSSGRRRGSR